MTIGFIGLGIMGKPMARNLIRNGHNLIVLDSRSRDAVKELLKFQVETAPTPADIVGKADIIITMLPNSPDVKDVVLGEGGIIEAASSGKVLIDMSSIAPLASREIARQLRLKGMDMLDAPVSGGEPKAIDGTIAVMVGGEEKVFDSCYDIMNAMAGSVTYVGEIGAGNTAKLCNQVVVALNISAVSEAMVLAKKAGVSPELVYNAIRGGLAGSTVMDAKVPMMMDRKFEPGFRIALHIKDMANVLDTSRSLGVPLPLTAQAMEIMQAIKQDGSDVEDHASIVKFYEKIANIEVTRNA